MLYMQCCIFSTRGMHTLCYLLREVKSIGGLHMDPTRHHLYLFLLLIQLCTLTVSLQYILAMNMIVCCVSWILLPSFWLCRWSWRSPQQGFSLPNFYLFSVISSVFQSFLFLFLSCILIQHFYNSILIYL